MQVIATINVLHAGEQHVTTNTQSGLLFRRKLIPCMKVAQTLQADIEKVFPSKA